jgi:hypothetical protein
MKKAKPTTASSITGGPFELMCNRFMQQSSDLVFRGAQHGSLETQAPTGAEFAPGWNYTIQIGYRMLFDVFR